MLQPYRVIQIVFIAQILHEDHEEISNPAFKHKNDMK